jgi:hypothetical protein
MGIICLASANTGVGEKGVEKKQERNSWKIREKREEKAYRLIETA